jgi:hypothetical protein
MKKKKDSRVKEVKKVIGRLRVPPKRIISSKKLKKIEEAQQHILEEEMEDGRDVGQGS